MKICVIGAGAIGCLVAGYLKKINNDTWLIGRQEAVCAITASGLLIQGCRGTQAVKIDISEKLSSWPDLVILCTKTQDIDRVLKENYAFVKQAPILTTQNGLRADEIVAGYLPKENIISSIVMFGATYLEPASVVHNFEGAWIIGQAFPPNGPDTVKLAQLLNAIFPTVVTEEIKGMKYLKLFVNANNCIAAILGKSMQECFSDALVSQISIAIWKEGLKVIARAGIKPVSLPDFPLERLTKLTSLPTPEAAGIFSGIMKTLSKEPLYGSILQSIKRGRPSEIDYINGEFVNLARAHSIEAPLNERLVGLVHRVEQEKRFFSKEELLQETKNYLA